MNAELLLIPSPARADTADTNRAALVTALNGCGMTVSNVLLIPCDPSALKRALHTAVSRSDLIVICGGIGTEPEDRTVATVCEAIGSTTHTDPGTLARLQEACPDAGDLSAAALVPSDAKLYSVAEGPLCGSVITAGSQIMLLLPDEPATLQAMLGKHLPAMLGLRRGFAVTTEPGETENAPAAMDFQPKEAVFYADDEEMEEIEPAEMPAPAPIEEDPDGLFEPLEPVAEEPAPAPALVLPPVAEEPAVAEWDASRLASRAEAESADTVADTEKETEKKNPFLSVVSFLIPWKGDTLIDVVRKLIFVVAVVGLVISGTYVYDYFAAKVHNDSLLNDARELYNAEDDTVNPNGTLHRFDKLLSQNPNCVGWVTIPNTKIDNPVYQADDNIYYTEYDATGKKNVYGAIFADFRCTVGKENSKNITLYGHHMRDGSMFANLHKYKAISFYQENPVLTFDTVYNTGGQYKIFACMITNADGKDDGGYFFDYTVPSYESEDAFLSWVEQVRRRSLYITPVDVLPGDEILTLSTCTYEIKDVELRCVVLARKIRAGESTRVNTSEVSANKKVIYPYVWYEHKGGGKPVYEDGLLTWLAQPNYVEPVYPPSSNATTSQGDPSSEETPSEETSSGEESGETPSEAPPTPSETPIPSEETSSGEESGETPSEAPPTPSETPPPPPPETPAE